MSMLEFNGGVYAGGQLDDLAERMQRRAQTTPPGMCPVELALAAIEQSAAQTCGKCVPCREGLPLLAQKVRAIAECRATERDYQETLQLARVIADASDCAIGWQAARDFLYSTEAYAVEYASHIDRHMCVQGTGQSVPCETECPAHVNVPGYIALTAQGDLAGAIAMIRKDNPFPTACGYVCEHPCEAHCRRRLIDAPLNIRGIKKYAVDGVAADTVPTPEALPASGRSVAVVGAGPSGLTAAYFLALMGHHVDVFEARKQLGGMMRYGIPAYRFPREKLDQDIRAILGAGDISVHAETPVDAAKMEELSAGHDAVYVAIGAQGGKMLDLPGADAEGVMSAVDLLTRIGDGDYPDFTGKRVVVIGGGNVAMDCARTSVRAGAASVQVAYRRRIDDMTGPAHRNRFRHAGGRRNPHAPVARPHRGRRDGPLHGARHPAPVHRRGQARPSGAAEGEQAAAAHPGRRHSRRCGPGHRIGPLRRGRHGSRSRAFHRNAPAQGSGSLPNVFVGGDCQLGPKTVILAVGAGKVAARNIDEFMGYHHTLNIDVEAPDPRPNDRQPYGRVEVHERIASERRCDFEGVELGMSEQEALQECGRCLRCDHYGSGSMLGGRKQYV